MLRLGRSAREDEKIYASRQYLFSGALDREQVERIAGGLLANDLIQHCSIVSARDFDRSSGIQVPLPRVVSTGEPHVSLIDLTVSDVDLMRMSRDGLIELECNRVLRLACIPGPHEIRRRDGAGGRFTVEIPFDQGLHQARELGPAGQRIVAGPGRSDPQRRHDVHVRVQTRQRPLYLAQHVAMPITHAAGVGPDLKNVVVPDIREILLPGRGHVHKVLLVRYAAVVAIGAVGALVAFALVPVLMTSRYQMNLASHILIWGLFAVSFNMLWGVTGMLSFGQALYFGIGAYSIGLLVTHAGKSWYLAAIPIGLVAAAGLSILLGLLVIRVSGVYFTMLTLAFAQLAWQVTFKWYDFTGGDDGIQGIIAPGLLANKMVYYYFVLAIVFLSVWFLKRLAYSPFGLVLRCVQQNPNRVRFIGRSV